LNKQQEDKVLQTYYWKEVYKENLDSMFLQAYDCELTLKKVQLNYLDLGRNYTQLENEYIDLNNNCTEELRKKDGLLEEKDQSIMKENKHKKGWRKVALVEGGVIIAIVTLIVLI
jgi:hypothetical protein